MEQLYTIDITVLSTSLEEVARKLGLLPTLKLRRYMGFGVYVLIIRSAKRPRRDTIAIMADILNVLVHGGPMRKTKLMNLANLNTKSFEQHVEGILVACGLIENFNTNNGRSEYIATSNGARFLQLVALLEDFLRVKQELINDVVSVRRFLFLKLRENYDVVLGGRITGRIGMQYYHDVIVYREKRIVGVIDVAVNMSIESLLLYSMFMLVGCLDTRVPHFLIVPDEHAMLMKDLLEDGCPQLVVEGYSKVDSISQRMDDTGNS